MESSRERDIYIYMKQLEGYELEGCEDDMSRVCKLNKTLYGLIQSPRA